MTIMLGTILSVATYVDGADEAGRDLAQARDRVQHGPGGHEHADLRAVARLAGPRPGDHALPGLRPSTAVTRCPTPTELTNLIASPDSTGATWQTQVRDNGGTSPNFYSDSTVLLAAGLRRQQRRAHVGPRHRDREGKEPDDRGARARRAGEHGHAARGGRGGRLELSNNGNKTAINLRTAPESTGSSPCAARS